MPTAPHWHMSPKSSSAEQPAEYLSQVGSSAAPPATACREQSFCRLAFYNIGWQSTDKKRAPQRSMSQDSTKKTVYRTNLDAKLSIGQLQQSYDVLDLGTRAVIQHTLQDLRGNAMPAASTGHIHHMFGSSPCEHKTPKSSAAQPAGLEENGKCPASVVCNNHQKTSSSDAMPPCLEANSTDSESAADANAAKPERHDANHSPDQDHTTPTPVRDASDDAHFDHPGQDLQIVWPDTDEDNFRDT